MAAQAPAKSRFLRFESPLAGEAFAYSPGDVVEYGEDSADEAQRLIDRGIAEEVTGEWALDAARKAGRVAVKKHRVPKASPVETATRQPERTATRGPAVKIPVNENDWPGGK